MGDIGDIRGAINYGLLYSKRAQVAKEGKRAASSGQTYQHLDPNNDGIINASENAEISVTYWQSIVHLYDLDLRLLDEEFVKPGNPQASDDSLNYGKLLNNRATNNLCGNPNADLDIDYESYDPNKDGLIERSEVPDYTDSTWGALKHVFNKKLQASEQAFSFPNNAA